MSEPNDEASDDLGVFLSGDARRSNDAPWRLQAYDRAGPLSASQIADLAQRFGLETAALCTLSTRMGFVLNPLSNIHLVPASRAKATHTAKSDLAYARRELRSLQARLKQVIERLSALVSGEDDEESPHSPLYAEMLNNLHASHKTLTQAEEIVENTGRQPGSVVKWEPLDKRVLKDRRRDQVLGAIFQFWVDAGRKITFTTHPNTSKRGGELVDFTQAVCACLTEPPTEISAETIVRSIRARGKRYSPMPEWALNIVNGEKVDRDT